MILDVRLSELFEEYLLLCEEVGADADLVREASKALLARYENKTMSVEQEKLSWRLENKWYDSLRHGEPEYRVYADDLYLAELWACWKLYSRRYLREIHSDRSMRNGRSLLSSMHDLSVVVDLGCGMGLTTVVLVEMFPDAKVIGTNLLGLKQTAVAKRLATTKGFFVLSDVEQVEVLGGLLFASEYFEHFLRPIEHLEEVVETLRPSVLLVANAFGSRSTGHFESYEVNEGLLWLSVDGRKVSRMFNDRLRAMGYVKVRTALWNDRPMYWKRRSC